MNNSLGFCEIPDGFLDFYQSVCACPCSSQECPKIINQAAQGYPPRGFYTRGTEGSVKILIVGKNPGHPLEEERALYCQKSSREIAEAQWHLIDQVFKNCHSPEMRKNRSMTFHRNLLRYFSYFLDLPPDEVFRYCAYTNLVKCQSIGEQDKLEKPAIDNCLDRHFQREYQRYRPSILVALGNEVFQALSRAKLQVPLIKLKHPSYFYSKLKEPATLQQLKRNIQEALRLVLNLEPCHIFFKT